MRRPPPRALSAFEAAARRGSFVKAAQELNVTTSAVSHQIKLLETFLGRRLFLRQNRGVRLTVDGAAYFASVRRAYDVLDDGTRRILDQPVAERLVIRCGVSFGLRWLVPRIPIFLSDHPDIDLQVVTPTEIEDERLRPVDIDIRYGTRERPGMEVVPLFEEDVLPLCSPVLLKGPDALREARDLGRFRLINSDISVINWAHFLTAQRLTGGEYATITFDNTLLALQAAVSGLGVALEGEFLAAEEIASGRLVVPPGLRHLRWRKCLRSFVVPQTQLSSPSVRVFREWLFGMLRSEGHAVGP